MGIRSAPRLRLPPEVGPQLSNPVRQSIARHPEVDGDIAVLPAVNNPALKQPEVVCLQIPEDGAESVIAHDVHWGDLAITSPASRSSA